MKLNDFEIVFLGLAILSSIAILNIMLFTCIYLLTLLEVVPYYFEMKPSLGNSYNLFYDDMLY